MKRSAQAQLVSWVQLSLETQKAQNMPINEIIFIGSQVFEKALLVLVCICESFLQRFPTIWHNVAKRVFPHLTQIMQKCCQIS